MTALDWYERGAERGRYSAFCRCCSVPPLMRPLDAQSTTTSQVDPLVDERCRRQTRGSRTRVEASMATAQAGR